MDPNRPEIPEGRPPAPPFGTGRVVRTAGLLEGFLAVLAIALGAFVGFHPAALIKHDLRGVLWGLLATLPMLAFLACSILVPWRPFRRISTVIDRLIVPMFRGEGFTSILLVSILAGLGEELFFRGLVQAGLADAIGGPSGTIIGLGVASILFGLAHPVTLSYGVTAALMGLYFGWLLIAFEDLLVPITAHATYDFVALYYYVYLRQRKRT